MIPETFEGFNIHHYKEVSSTNEEALDLIDKGISAETVIIADKQTKGRGRTGKSWVSPEGNFYGSLIFNQKTDVSKLTELTFIAALAVGNTLLSCIDDLNLQYKWPNDILIDNKKISGILLERKSNSNWLIIGIGININHAPLPEATCISRFFAQSAAISESSSVIQEPHPVIPASFSHVIPVPFSHVIPVLDTGIHSSFSWIPASRAGMTPLDLLKELIINFNKLRKEWLLSGFDAIREMWLQRAFKLNKQISIKLAEKLYEGTFTDIDKSGRLVLQQKDRSLIYFDAGELFIGET